MILKRLTQGAGLVAGAVIVIPSLISALSPALAGRRAPLWRRLGRLDQFPVGAVRDAVIGAAAEGAAGEGAAGEGGRPQRFLRSSVYVWRPQADRLVVFSRACTDLGCPVNYDPGSGFYYCPCHGGIFNGAGEPVAGPPARPLDEYATRVRNGVLEVNVTSVPVPS